MITEKKRLRILITGITGLVGSALKEFLEKKGHEVIGLSYKGTHCNLKWDPYKSIMPITDFAGIDIIINLTGETVAQYWTKTTKKRIYDSRLLATNLLVQTILKSKNPPILYISASSASIYEMSALSPATENSQLTTNDSFLTHVIRDWESAIEILDKRGIRRVNLRLGHVLSKKGGFLSPMLLSFKCGFGGYQGSGNQLISWIDIDDLIQAIYFCILNETILGPVNMVSPHPISNKHFCKALGKVLNRPVWLPVPAFLLKLIFGKEFAQELILNDQNVYPKKLLDAGFEFQYPHIEESLTHLLK